MQRDLNETEQDERRKALVISVSDYSDPKIQPLSFCGNDGSKMYEVLTDLGYHISEGHKLIGKVTYEKMRESIIDFFTDPDIKANDTLLFYYSGHGIPDVDGDVYFASSDINPDAPFRKGFPFSELTKMMQRSLSIRIVTILDCCYSGAARLSKGHEEDVARIGTATIANQSGILQQGEGKCLLAASQATQEAYALNLRGHSIFTYYLLEGLRGNEKSVDSEGNVTPYTLGTYVYKAILNLPISSRPKQKPLTKVETSGDIILANYPHLIQSQPDEQSAQLSDKEPQLRKRKGSLENEPNLRFGAQTILPGIVKHRKLSLSVVSAIVVGMISVILLFNFIGQQNDPPELIISDLNITGLDAGVTGTASGKHGKEIAEVLFEWGDGRSESGTFPISHRYVKPGTYNLTVTAKDNNNMGTVRTELIEIIDQSTYRVSHIPVGKTPDHISVNPNTNLIYVANWGDDVISAINGTTNEVTPIKVGNQPHSLVINPSTNLIYVTYELGDKLGIINGTTNKILKNLSLSMERGKGLDVNPVTNTIYVANFSGNNISVINGTSNTLLKTIPVDINPVDVAVNPNTNMIYVSNYGSNTVSVIQGNNNTKIKDIQTGTQPGIGISVNPITNTVYATNTRDDSVSVIDGNDNTANLDIRVGTNPQGVTINSNSNLIYVSNSDSNTVSVIDGNTNMVIDQIEVRDFPNDVAINQNTSLVYVSNAKDNSVSVLQPKYLQ